MAYTILLTNSHRDNFTSDDATQLYLRLVTHTEKDGRFILPVLNGIGGRHMGGRIDYTFSGLPRNSRLPRYQIEMRGIRLAEAKPYCGNHPGECVVPPFGGPRKKPKRRWLEWDDWVAFHALVNVFLDQEKVEADVWTKPQDAKGRFWIRRNNKPRTRFDWTETLNAYGQPLRVWNLGDKDDQYAPVPPDLKEFLKEIEEAAEVYYKLLDTCAENFRKKVLIPFCDDLRLRFIAGMGSCSFTFPSGRSFGQIWEVRHLLMNADDGSPLDEEMRGLALKQNEVESLLAFLDTETLNGRNGFGVSQLGDYTPPKYEERKAFLNKAVDEVIDEIIREEQEAQRA